MLSGLRACACVYVCFFSLLFRFHSLCHWCPFIYAMTTTTTTYFSLFSGFITIILLCDTDDAYSEMASTHKKNGCYLCVCNNNNMSERECGGKRWWSDDIGLDLLFIQSINFNISVMLWQPHKAASASVAVATRLAIHHPRIWFIAIATDTIDETICRIFENGSVLKCVCVPLSTPHDLKSIASISQKLEK